jgi:hypothetical protein
VPQSAGLKKGRASSGLPQENLENDLGYLDMEGLQRGSARKRGRPRPGTAIGKKGARSLSGINFKNLEDHKLPLKNMYTADPKRSHRFFVKKVPQKIKKQWRKRAESATTASSQHLMKERQDLYKNATHQDFYISLKFIEKRPMKQVYTSFQKTGHIVERTPRARLIVQKVEGKPRPVSLGVNETKKIRFQYYRDNKKQKMFFAQNINQAKFT